MGGVYKLVKCDNVSKLIFRFNVKFTSFFDILLLMFICLVGLPFFTFWDPKNYKIVFFTRYTNNLAYFLKQKKDLITANWMGKLFR